MRWVVMRPSGKKNPLDRQPAPKGRFVIVLSNNIPVTDAGDFQDGIARTYQPGDGDAPRYESHFATCPQREQHKRDAPKAQEQPHAIAPDKWKRAHCPGCGARFADVFPGSRCGTCFDRSTSLVELVEGEP